VLRLPQSNIQTALSLALHPMTLQPLALPVHPKNTKALSLLFWHGQRKHGVHSFAAVDPNVHDDRAFVVVVVVVVRKNLNVFDAPEGRQLFADSAPMLRRGAKHNQPARTLAKPPRRLFLRPLSASPAPPHAEPPDSAIGGHRRFPKGEPLDSDKGSPRRLPELEREISNVGPNGTNSSLNAFARHWASM